jgi:hypothetical protein
MNKYSFLFYIGLLSVFSCTQTPKNQPGSTEEEGYGLNNGSRRYYEFIRNADPATGVIRPHIRSEVAEFVSRLPGGNHDRSLLWSSRGPFNKGGRTRALAIDVTNSNALLAGGVTGGMWRSTDGGSSWSKTTTAAQIHTVSSIVQDTRPGHENTWYHGTGEEFYGVVSGTSFTSLFSGDGIFKSTDGGLSWSQLMSTASGTPQSILQNGSYDFVWHMAIDHTNLAEEEVYAAVYSGIIRSTDGGNTWQEVLGFGTSGIEFTDIMITPGGILYAALSYANPTNAGGLFRSTDGINWTNISPAWFTGQRRTAMCINPQNENEVYFITEIIGNGFNTVNHTLAKYTYLSGDGSGGGGAWDNRSANIPDQACNLYIGDDFDFGTFRSQFSYDLCIAHHPTQANVLFIGGTNIHRSNSAFANDDADWIGGYRCNVETPVQYSYPNHHSDEHLMLFSPDDPNVMYNTNDGGIYKTTNVMADSVSWTPLNNGYVNTQFYTVAMEQGHASSNYIFGGMQDNGTWIGSTTNSNDPWHEVHADDGSFCALPEGREYFIASSQSGRIYKKTIDNNGVLTGTRRIDPDNGPAQLFINPLFLDPYNQNDLYIAGNRTIWWLANVSSYEVNGDYYTALDNDFWTNISASLIPTSHGSISCLDKCIVDNSIIYYGTIKGKLWRLDDCYGTAPVKTEITSTSFPTNAYMSCVTVHDFNPEEAILSFSNYNIPSIFHTTDGGLTFTDISGNLEENPDGSGSGPGVYWVEIYPSDPAIYYAATSAGLFSTSELDGSNTVWQMEGASTIGNVIINMVDARPYDGAIAVGTHGNGVYSSSLAPVDAASVYDDVADKLNSGAYPNPFSGTLSIPIRLNTASDVTIRIYDLKGNLVHEMQQRNIEPSVRNLSWTPSTLLSSGAYLYVLNVGSETKTGKVIYK